MNEIYTKYPESFDRYTTIRMTHNGFPVGYARLIREENVVTIADMFIYDRVKQPVKFLPWFKIYRNYRNRGHGSQLLNNVINYCMKQGILEIIGVAKGELAALKPWYMRHGFNVNENNEIYLKLNA